MDKWYRLDNAAKVFPSVSGTKNSSVFRFSAVLTEPVNPENLQAAVDLVMPRFPMFGVRLRKGIFWNYLDENPNRLFIEQDSKPPCQGIQMNDEGDFLLRIFYYNNRLSLEMFHALTDGSGALEFFKSLLFYYFQINNQLFEHEEKIKRLEDPLSIDEVADSFSDYYTPIYSENVSLPSSFHIRGVPFESGDNTIVHATLNSSELNQKAKQYGGSITAYLAAVLIYAIYQTRSYQKDSRKPIVIAVPVNLRQKFPSNTLRNFFSVVNVGAYMDETITVEKLVPLIQEMLLQKTSQANLQAIINNNVRFQQNIASKFIPLFIKNFLVRFGFDYFSERRKTITLSNLGRVALPTCMYPLIQHMEIAAYPTQKSPMACGLISCGEVFTISFIRNIVESDIIQYFFSYLATVEGLKVSVYGNQLNEKTKN